MGEVISYTKEGIETLITEALEGFATQEDIETALAALVDASPETLNTLNELAAALGDDPNFATTTATTLGVLDTRLDALDGVSDTLTSLDSRLDTLEGTPVGVTLPVARTVTDSTTLVLMDASKQVEVNASIAKTVTIPANATVAFPIGTVVLIVQKGSGQVQIVAEGGVTLNSPSGSKTNAANAIIWAIKRGTNDWVLWGGVTNENLGAGISLVVDTFASGTGGGANLSGQTTEVGGLTWSTLSGASAINKQPPDGTGQGTASEVGPSNTSGIHATVLDLGITDFLVEVVIGNAILAGSLRGIVAKAVDANNHWRFVVAQNGTLYLQKRASGSYTNVWNSAAGVGAAGDTLQLSFVGTTITAVHNGGVVYTGTDATYQDSTNAGLFIEPTGNRYAYLRDFAVYSVTGSIGNPDVIALASDVTDLTATVALKANTTDLSKIDAVTPTDNYTLVLTDAGKVIEMDKATAVNLTVPLNATVAFPIGTVIEIWQKGAGQVTIVPTVGVTIRSTEGKLKLYGQYTSVSLRKRAENEWVAVGDLVA